MPDWYDQLICPKLRSSIGISSLDLWKLKLLYRSIRSNPGSSEILSQLIHHFLLKLDPSSTAADPDPQEDPTLSLTAWSDLVLLGFLRAKWWKLISGAQKDMKHSFFLTSNQLVEKKTKNTRRPINWTAIFLQKWSVPKRVKCPRGFLFKHWRVEDLRHQQVSSFWM